MLFRKIKAREAAETARAAEQVAEAAAAALVAEEEAAAARKKQKSEKAAGKKVRAAKAKAARSQPAPSVALSAVGFLVSIAGLAIEIISDLQKWNFKNNNPSDQFIQSGLWGISQVSPQ